MSATVLARSETPEQQFQKISDEYFDRVYFPNQPTAGTIAGYHQYDTKLEDFSRKSIDAEVAALNEIAKRLSAVPGSALSSTTSSAQGFQ